MPPSNCEDDGRQYERIAESAFRKFKTACARLSKTQQLLAAKRLLKLVRERMEELEKQV